MTKRLQAMEKLLKEVLDLEDGFISCQRCGDDVQCKGMDVIESAKKIAALDSIKEDGEEEMDEARSSWWDKTWCGRIKILWRDEDIMEAFEAGWKAAREHEG